MSRSWLNLSLAALVISLFAGCGLLKGGGAEYHKSSKDIPLEVPSDLKPPRHDGALKVPE